MSSAAAAFLDYWEEKITKDLSPFCDPGTILKVERSGKSILCKWNQKFTDLSAIFHADMATGVTVKFNGNDYSYRSFIASPEISDLRGLAKMILQSHKQGVFIEPKGFLDGESSKAGPAIKILKEEMLQTDPLVTNVIMVTGDAGAGKTSMLQRLVYSFSESFYKGESDKLLLYINAQGRALARFNEALATELNELRSTLHYHAISTLVRNDLLIPVIDGFDELLGVSGYDDAFSSLSTFIEELDGSGSLIASARSTYYETEFVARANKISNLGSHTWKQILFHLKSWGDDEVANYISEFAGRNSLSEVDLAYIRKSVNSIFTGKSADLKTKPLFLTKIVSLLSEGTEISNTDDLLSAIVNIYVDRECKQKLLDKSGTPILKHAELIGLLKNVSEEMWNLETRELNKISIREIAEYSVHDSELAPRAKEIIAERLPTMAFLTIGATPGSIQFEHEIFFGFFLSKKISEVLSSEATPIARAMILGRSILPSDISDVISRELRILIDSNDSLKGILSNICGATDQPTSRAALVRENCGNIAASLISNQPFRLDGHVVFGLTFSNSPFDQVRFFNSKFRGVEFKRINFSSTKFEKCLAEEASFWEITVDPNNTVLEFEGWDPETQLVGIKLVSDPDYSYDPIEVKEILTKVNATVGQSVAPLSQSRKIPTDVKKVMERFVRAYNRSNPICVADDNLRTVFEFSGWDKIENLLIKSKVVTKETRHTGGPAKEFLRRQVLPNEILNGINRAATVPESVRKFWDSLEEKYK